MRGGAVGAGVVGGAVGAGVVGGAVGAGVAGGDVTTGRTVVVVDRTVVTGDDPPARTVVDVDDTEEPDEDGDDADVVLLDEPADATVVVAPSSDTVVELTPDEDDGETSTSGARADVTDDGEAPGSEQLAATAINTDTDIKVSARQRRVTPMFVRRPTPNDVTSTRELCCSMNSAITSP